MKLAILRVVSKVDVFHRHLLSHRRIQLLFPYSNMLTVGVAGYDERCCSIWIPYQRVSPALEDPLLCALLCALLCIVRVVDAHFSTRHENEAARVN